MSVSKDSFDITSVARRGEGLPGWVQGPIISRAWGSLWMDAVIEKKEASFPCIVVEVRAHVILQHSKKHEHRHLKNSRTSANKSYRIEWVRYIKVYGQRSWVILLSGSWVCESLSVTLWHPYVTELCICMSRGLANELLVTWGVPVTPDWCSAHDLVLILSRHGRFSVMHIYVALWIPVMSLAVMIWTILRHIYY